MSETQCRSVKTSKPFCSLAYLAKSTTALNGTNNIKIANGHINNGSNDCLPAPTTTSQKITTKKLTNGTTTKIKTANGCDNAPVSAAVSADDKQNAVTTNESELSKVMRNLHSVASHEDDIFGIIKEEEEMSLFKDQVDNGVAVDPRRPWELSNNNNNNYAKCIAPLLLPGSAATMSQNDYRCLGNNCHNNGHFNGGGHSNCGGGHSSLTSLTQLNSLDCWDYTIELECLQGPQDLQLAAELGKTLLERNKELETLLKEHKCTVDEQEQEILYLKKHTTALREVNDSRLKVYEQLEVGIQDLERANHRLLVENASDKKHIKSLVHNIENLEARCDELNKQLDETRQALSIERRKNDRLLQEKNGADHDSAAVHLKPVDQSAANANTSNNSSEPGYDANTTAPENCSFAFQSPRTGQRNANSTGISGSSGSSKEHSVDLSMVCSGEENDEIIKLVNDLETTKKAFLAEQQRCTELEEQLVAIIQENQTLQSRIAQTSANEEMKSMHDELSILDEVRQGQMCCRCLRAVEDRGTINDEQSSMAPTEEEEEEEDEERSLLDLEGGGNHRNDNVSEHSQAAYRSNVSIKVAQRVVDSLDFNLGTSPNPYRDLVEKYEALLEVQIAKAALKSGNSLSLAEEFQTSDQFAHTQKLMPLTAAGGVTESAAASGDGASSCNGSLNNEAASKNMQCKNTRGRTPTEFSEAETSSSGYSDETSNKFTQTDVMAGNFLCSIGDGDVCKFDIYDNISPIDTRFRNRPEYRDLFKEIFGILKKAAENKEEGEKLPLLDDTHPSAVAAAAAACAKVPPVTPANEQPPVDFGDDSQSIISSAVSEQSFAMSECITKLERKTAKKYIIEKNQENKPPTLAATSTAQLTSSNSKQLIENGRVLTPLKREPLEYLSVGVGIKKKNRKKIRNFSNDRSESPLTLPSPPRFLVSSGKKRRDVRPYTQSPMAATSDASPSAARNSRGGAKFEWNGTSMVIYNRTAGSPHHAGLRGRELDMNSIEFRPSTVSQELHKLKKLDLSYAEVLRRADACKPNHSHHHNHHQQQRHPQQQQQQQQQSPGRFKQNNNHSNVHK